MLGIKLTTSRTRVSSRNHKTKVRVDLILLPIWGERPPMGDEGPFLPNCQTNLVIALPLIFWHFINTIAYHLGRYQPSSPTTELHVRSNYYPVKPPPTPHSESQPWITLSSHVLQKLFFFLTMMTMTTTICFFKVHSEKRKSNSCAQCNPWHYILYLFVCLFCEP